MNRKYTPIRGSNGHTPAETAERAANWRTEPAAYRTNAAHGWLGAVLLDASRAALPSSTHDGICSDPDSADWSEQEWFSDLLLTHPAAMNFSGRADRMERPEPDRHADHDSLCAVRSMAADSAAAWARSVGADLEPLL